MCIIYFDVPNPHSHHPPTLQHPSACLHLILSSLLCFVTPWVWGCLPQCCWCLWLDLVGVAVSTVSSWVQSLCPVQKTAPHSSSPVPGSHSLSSPSWVLFPVPWGSWYKCPVWDWALCSHVFSCLSATSLCIAKLDLIASVFSTPAKEAAPIWAGLRETCRNCIIALKFSTRSHIRCMLLYPSSWKPRQEGLWAQNQHRVHSKRASLNNKTPTK